MVERALRQESAGWNGAADGHRDHDPRDCSRGSERDWMRVDNFFAGFQSRILRSDYRRHFDYRALLRPANGEGLCRRGNARALFSADIERDLSAGAVREPQITRMMLSSKLAEEKHAQN